MRISLSSKKLLSFYVLIYVMLFAPKASAQVGIGTVTPDASSLLDISSTTQGMLTPRMTTAQRLAIANPANGLMVYDTEAKSFEYYDSSTSSWIKVYGDKEGRTKFKRIKSTDSLSKVLETELAAGGGAKYVLDSTTFYEINGTVVFNFPIEMNNAYIGGMDTSDDKLVKLSGDLFTGATGGSLKSLTLVASGGNVFNLTGTGSIAGGTQTQSLTFRDCFVANSASIGKIENFALVFLSIVNFSGNTNGIIYKDISRLLISNAGWMSNNSGTYETFQGTFNLIGKIGGFSEVIGANIGVDVSSNPVITGDAIMETVVFTGTLTSGQYVKGYTPAINSGFNFNNKWTIRSTGIPTEADAVATGDINIDYPVGSGASTTLTGTPVKLAGTTTSSNLFRFSTDGVNNRLKYIGTKSRYFKVTGSASFQSSSNGAVYVFYVAKNGIAIPASKVYVTSNSPTDIIAMPIVVTVPLAANDYIEVFVMRYSGTGNILTVSLNLIVN